VANEELYCLNEICKATRRNLQKNPTSNTDCSDKKVTIIMGVVSVNQQENNEGIWQISVDRMEEGKKNK
jgi:hypothetical protein